MKYIIILLSLIVCGVFWGLLKVILPESSVVDISVSVASFCHGALNTWLILKLHEIGEKK